jgi:UDP-N-acetylmuramyl pentapeptide synthase
VGTTGYHLGVILLEDLAAAVPAEGAHQIGPVAAREFEGFAYDSRNVRGGELFVALKTERADGHDFITDAIARGASGVLCERVPAVVQEARESVV